VLAKPGTLATVIMLGQNVRITTTVAPLQPGVRGQIILVRDLSSARLMTAEVVDENLLQMRF
jgi:flagella basal body P-ring formation protein FlgA